MCEITFCTFVENEQTEQREFSPASSLYAAVRAVRSGEADGLFVNLYHGDHHDEAYEVKPCRPMVAYFGYWSDQVM